MYYIDIRFLEYIEHEKPKKELERWISVWETTLADKHLIGPVGSDVQHDVHVVGSQLVITTICEHADKGFEMRLGSKHFSLEKDPEFYPIKPEDWLPEIEEDCWN